jgi:hypothetical protein
VRVSVEIPVEPEASYMARDVVARTMADSSAPQDRVEEALLLTSEVVSRAIRLSNQDPESAIGLLIDVSSDRLRVEVTDRLVDPDLLSMPAPSNKEAGGGWGLIFVAELSDRWGAEADSIWFELNL